VAVLPHDLSPKDANTLATVPVFDWSYGCAATAAAMLFGHYDRTGYSNMYNGPTNGGFCPEDNLVWGQTTYYPSGETCGECPLSATHQGIDGRVNKGHVDDYWVDYASTAQDPFIGNWTEHPHGECTADYMGTNQDKYNNEDGSTVFAVATNGDPTHDFADAPGLRDGCHGMRLFSESRGYDVVDNFTQYIYGQAENPSNGFTFADYVAEIDAGRPVMIHVRGHAMLGFGYNTSGNDVVYLYDTWDHLPHGMTWGGVYGDGFYQHIAVTVFRLEPEATLAPLVSTGAATSVGETGGVLTATLNGVIDNDGGGDCEYRFEYDIDSGEPYAHSTGWTGSNNTGESFSETVSSLAQNTAYYFRAQAKNTVATSSGAEMTFVTPKICSVTLAASLSDVSLDIDGATYLPGDLPAVFSWAEGSVHECVAPTPVLVSEGTQYLFTSWSDGHTSPSRTLTIAADASYTANYTTQHYLTVDSDQGDPAGEGWYDEGSDVDIETAQTISDGDTRFVFSAWTIDGDDESDSTVTVTMDAPHTAVASYTTQHYFSVSSQYGDEPSGEGWYDEGDQAATGNPEEVIYDESVADTRYVFSNWAVDEDAQTGETVSLTVDAPHTAVAEYDTQHYLTVHSDYGDPTGEGWYDDGSVATVSVTSPVGTLVRKVFAGWTGDLSGTASTQSITIDEPKTVTAEWRDDYLYLYFIGGGAFVVLAGASLVLAMRKGKAPSQPTVTY